MNPHTPEFVPRKAWGRNPVAEDSKSLIDTSKGFSSSEEKDDQRLKEGNSDTGAEAEVNEKSKLTESSSEEIVNDSAIIKIRSSNEEQLKEVDLKKKKKNKQQHGDGEGFVVVTKGRRNRQHFTSGVYNQKSLSASAR